MDGYKAVTGRPASNRDTTRIAVGVEKEGGHQRRMIGIVGTEKQIALQLALQTGCRR